METPQGVWAVPLAQGILGVQTADTKNLTVPRPSTE